MHQLSLFDTPPQPNRAETPALPAPVAAGLAALGWRYEGADGDRLVYVAPPGYARWLADGRERLLGAAWEVRYRALAGLCWRCGAILAPGEETDLETCRACSAAVGVDTTQ